MLHSGNDSEDITRLKVGLNVNAQNYDNIRLNFACDMETARMRVFILCDGLIDILAAHFDVCGRDLRSPKRQTVSVARVRQIGMYVSHVTLGISMTLVGHGFGRDKSTVIHACHTIEDMRDDKEFDQVVSKVEAIVRGAFKISFFEGNGGKANE